MQSKIIVVTALRCCKLPYSDEQNEYMPREYQALYSESTDDGFDPDSDIVWKEIHALVQEVYRRRGEKCPVTIQPFNDLLGTNMQGTDGVSYFIEDYESYLRCYGLEYCNLYWLHQTTTLACIALNEEEAEAFIETNQYRLVNPEIKTVTRSTFLLDSGSAPIVVV